MSQWTQTEITLMKRSLTLARKALGRTNPNPMVGAVIAKGEKVISEGYHRRAGADHAEIAALKQAGKTARGATLLVTLEPCSHQGRTPACAPVIAPAGIREVIIGTLDPNPLVAGKGIEILKKSGVKVKVGLLGGEINELNKAYNKYIVAKTPFVIMKAAVSLDGKLATYRGQSRWISSEKSRIEAHRLRARSDAVMVGVNTILADDPELTVRDTRLLRPIPPLRVVVDSRLRSPLKAKIFLTAKEVPTLVAAATGADAKKAGQLEKLGVDVVFLKPDRDGRVPLRLLIKELGQREVMQLLIEGGGTLNFSALSEGIVDRVVWIQAPIIIGGQDAIEGVSGLGFATLEECARLDRFQVRRVGPDLWIEADVAGSEAQELLEDFKDSRELEQMRKKGLKFIKLDDFLKEYHP